LNKVKIAFVGCVVAIAILVVSNLWLFATFTSQINDSQTQLNDRNNQIQTLQNQVANLSDRIAELETEVKASNESYVTLNQSHTDLQREYEDLLFHYNLLNKPASNFTTVQDLEITFTLDKTIYYYKDPVTGNATIRYLNGTAFEGLFRIDVESTHGILSLGERYALKNGFAKFYLEPPVFYWGPGAYIIRIGTIYTIDGYEVASFKAGSPGVQVEAK
jgi:cell division protein FtsB